MMLCFVSVSERNYEGKVMFTYLILELYVAEIIDNRNHNKINFKILARQTILRSLQRSKMSVYSGDIRRGILSKKRLRGSRAALLVLKLILLFQSMDLDLSIFTISS